MGISRKLLLAVTGLTFSLPFFGQAEIFVNHPDSLVTVSEHGDTLIRYFSHSIPTDGIRHPSSGDRLPLVLSKSESDRRMHARDDSLKTALAARREEESVRGGTDIKSLDGYSVGAIPLESGVSPSGAKTYSIPIATAPGFGLVPSIALSYNSQATEGWVGYGWDIAGLSSVTIINDNIYYHGYDRAANVFSSNPHFALDGVPLVTNDNVVTSSEYPLVTATGHILVAPHRNAYGYRTGFTALYPNGMRAEFGIVGNTVQYNYPSYPITEIQDIEGNLITFHYVHDSVNGNDRLTSVRYGYAEGDSYQAEIVFTYTPETSYPIRYYAGKTVSRAYRLTGISSNNGSSVLSEYSLSYETRDNVSLLTEVECSNGQGSSLPTLEFSYGQGVIPSAESGVLQRNDYQCVILALGFSGDNVIYKRGKFVEGGFDDGLIIYPEFTEYGVTQSGLLGLVFGSLYPANQKILFVPRVKDYNDVDDTILTGEGFQTIEAADVDGDGTDELVKVNLELSMGGTTISVRIYRCNSSGHPEQTDLFTVTLLGSVQSGIFVSPCRRTFRFGDFDGDGKAELLAVAFDKNYNPRHNYDQTCYTALIDLESHAVVFDTELFSFPLDRYNCLITCDIDGDSRTELCYATDSGFDIYQKSSYGTFSKTSSLPTPTASILSDTERPCYITDINGDGLVDIMRAPPAGTMQLWMRYAFTGQTFSASSMGITNRSSSDTFMFMDLNRDGFADLVKISSGESGAAIGTYLNLNGRSFGSYKPSVSSISDANGIVFANISRYSEASCFIKFDGLFGYIYDFTAESPAIRSLTKAVDSYERSWHNSYAYLPSKALEWTDTSFHVRSPGDYAGRVLPIYVLRSEEEFTGRYFNHWLHDEYYEYYNGTVHNKGLGFCGFRRIRKSDHYRTEGWPATVYTEEDFDPEKRGVVTYVATRYGASSAEPAHTVTNTYDSLYTTHGKFRPRLSETVSADSLTEIKERTSYTYDAYDFPTEVVTYRRIGGGTAKTTTIERSYRHRDSTTRYVLGAVTHEAVIKDAGLDRELQWNDRMETTFDDMFRPVCRKFYSGKYGVRHITINPQQHLSAVQLKPHLLVDSTMLVSTTRWTYDAWGNVTSEMTAPYDATEYTGSTFTYDSAGRYLQSSTDALGHTATYSGYDRFGNPASVTDHLGRVTSFTYDDWGNLVRTDYPDGTFEEETASWGGAGLWTVRDSTSGAPVTVTHYDALGRVVRTAHKRFDGQWSMTDREYDGAGRPARVSLPYRSGSPSLWSTYSYDAYGRPVSVTEASGRSTTWSYSGTSTTTVKDGITSTSVTDAEGKVVSVTDAGGTITWTLRNDGQPSAVTAPGGAVTTFTYDEYGRRTGITDPGAGTHSWSYACSTDGSSQTTHTGPNGSITTLRDKYGRVTAVQRPGEFNTTYTYDTYGRLTGEHSGNGTATAYTYDAFDRVATVTDSVPDLKWLRRTFTYATDGRVASVKYTTPSGDITTESYTYANGHNTGIYLPDGSTVWALLSENALGQPTSGTTGTLTRSYYYSAYGFPTARSAGSGPIELLSFNTQNGNLQTRDVVGRPQETFGYDTLDRLTSVSSGGTTSQVSYATNGNITSIGGVGSFTYADPGNPYRQTGFTPDPPGEVPFPDRTVSYNSSDRPEAISAGGRTAALTYDGEGDRARMQLCDSTGTILTRYYIGGRYELDQTPSGTKERLYLGGDAYSAPMVYVREGSGSWTLYNIGRDYLGSITYIATAGGAKVAEYSYDAWGRLRDPVTLAAYAPGSEPELFLGRGFTGHEHLPWCGLVNMNARLYDPLTGRFLSPDPYVQAPEFTQNYNRYSYALNNPLKYTDESGELLTWNIGFNGLSIGVNFTPAGIPLGLGINVGWGNGFSLGVYGEIGYRIGGTYMGAGITSSVSCNFNFWYYRGAISMSSGAFASLGPLSVSAMTETSMGQTDWNAGVSLGFGDAISGIGLFAGYGSGGWNAGISGYFDNSRRIAFRRGVNTVELNGDDPLLATDDMLRKMQELWYPDAPMDNIKNFSVENVPSNIKLLLDSPDCYATTIPLKRGGRLSGNSSVYFSTKAFVSARQLYTTMGHEFVHVCNYITAAKMAFSMETIKSKQYLDMTEYWAYSYEALITHTTMNSFDMMSIMGYFNYEIVSAFSYLNMDWYKTRSVIK